MNFSDEFQGIDKLIYFESLDSTNNYAKNLPLNERNHGTLIIANEQTSGRGRHGKSFFSPKDSGLYMSLILENKGIEDFYLITYLAAVCLCKSLRKLYNVGAKIKWVNDIFLENKKICGILTEGVFNEETGDISHIILGIGINCSTKTEDFPENLKNIASSFGEKEIHRGKLAEEIRSSFLKDFGNLNKEKILKEYEENWLMMGRKISFFHDGKEKEGIVCGLGKGGELLVETQNTEKISLIGGEIRFI